MDAFYAGIGGVSGFLASAQASRGEVVVLMD